MGSGKKHRDRDKEKDKDRKKHRHKDRDHRPSSTSEKHEPKERRERHRESRKRRRHSSLSQSAGDGKPSSSNGQHHSSRKRSRHDDGGAPKGMTADNVPLPIPLIIKDEPSSDGEEVIVASGKEMSLSIEETNKLRAKLGLRPLDVRSSSSEQKSADGSSAGSKAAPDDSFKPPPDVHVPPENIGQKKFLEKMREKIATHREKRRIQEKLKKQKTLGAGSDSDDDVQSWVVKSRHQQTEKEKAEQQAKQLAEMDEEFGVGDVVSEEVYRSRTRAYTSRDLRGMQVQHSSERFQEGTSTILTLKDKGVLDADDDVLVNVNIIDAEKTDKNLENKKQKPTYQPWDDEDPIDEFGQLKPKRLLAKYDEEIEGAVPKSFTLGSKGGVNLEKEKQVIKERLAAIQSSRNIENLNVDLMKPANEYYTEEEMVTFKKLKKKVKRRIRKPRPLKADDLAPLAGHDSLGYDLGKKVLQKGSIPFLDDEPMDLEILDLDDTDLPRHHEDVSNVVLEPDEAEEELQIALHKSRKLKLQEERRGADKVLQVVESLPPKPSTDRPVAATTSTANKGSIILNATAEFCRALGDIPTYGMAGNREEDADDLAEFEREREERKRQEVEPDEVTPYRGAWNQVDIDKTPIEFAEKETVILDEEPDVGVGIAGALKLAVKKGYLEQEMKKLVSAPRPNQLQAANYTIEDKNFLEDDRVGRRYTAGPVSDFKEKQHYKPDVKLEYIDDSGRLLNAKEAFRYLSHKFHGKGSGKNKTEKRVKKLQEEALMRQMSSTDTPLGTLSLLQEKQKQTQSPFIVLSGGNKALTSTSISKKS